MKNFTFPVLLLLLCFGSHATTFFVTVSNFQFSPSNIPNLMVGDIIQFNFGGVNGHNVASAPLGMVPAGAVNLFSGNPGAVTASYSYTVTVPGNYRYYCQVHSPDGVSGMVGTFTVSGVAPVTLKNFNVSYSGNYISARWQTVTEQNVGYFTLLKSTDGKNYVEAGRVQATGNSSTTRSYTYKDDAPAASTKYVYYELKTVDNDGKYYLSEVKLLRNEKASPLLITQMAPNPVTRSIGHLMFQFNADRTETMKAIVKDASGKTVMDLDLYAVKGINNGHIHMGSLPAGLYTIIFSLDGIKEIKKVMVVP